MTRFLLPLYIGAVLSLLIACDNKSNSPASKVDSTEVPLAVEQGPGHDDARHLTAEAEYGGHRYTFDLYKTPADSLPPVKDRYGDPYLDNRVKVVILRDGPYSAAGLPVEQPSVRVLSAKPISRRCWMPMRAKT